MTEEVKVEEDDEEEDNEEEDNEEEAKVKDQKVSDILNIPNKKLTDDAPQIQQNLEAQKADTNVIKQ